jgi:hypothetical protein
MAMAKVETIMDGADRLTLGKETPPAMMDLLSEAQPDFEEARQEVCEEVNAICRPKSSRFRTHLIKR